MSSKSKLLILTIVFTSCAPPMVGVYVKSSPSPNIAISETDKFAITTTPDHDFEDGFFAKKLVAHLNTNRNNSAAYYPSKMQNYDSATIVGIILSRFDTMSYSYKAPEYGMVNSGKKVTDCNSSGYGYSTDVHCEEKEKTEFGVTGYRDSRKYLQAYSILINFYKIDTKELVFQTVASAYENKCSRNWYYNFLLYESSKLLFSPNIVEKKYSREFPQDWNCGDFEDPKPVSRTPRKKYNF